MTRGFHFDEDRLHKSVGASILLRCINPGLPGLMQQ
jgi:hypothetical protein